MPSNQKEYMKEYMKVWRLPKSLLSRVKSLQEFVKEWAESLQEVVKISPEPLQEAVKDSVESLRKVVKTLQEVVKISPEPLQEAVKKNGEICEKTAFSAENAHVLGKGGFGGVGEINGTFHINNANNNNGDNSSLTDVDVERVDSLKEKNRKKRKEKIRNSAKPYSPEFERLWAFYPRHDGTSKIKAWEAFQKSEMPELNFLLAVLCFEKDKDQWQDESKIPHLATWINQRRWEGYDEAKIRASMRYKQLRGAKQAATSKPELPTLAEWNSFSLEKQFALANALRLNQSHLEAMIKSKEASHD